MSERSGLRIAVRSLRPEEILSEEEACAMRPHPKFLPPWETAGSELRRTYERARARLRHVFVGPLIKQTLLVQTPTVGLAAVWRIWYGSTPLQVVRALAQSDQTVLLDSGVINIPEQDIAACQFIVDRILTDLPPWVH